MVWAEREVSVFIRSECYEPFVPRGSFADAPPINAVSDGILSLLNGCNTRWRREYHEQSSSVVFAFP